MFTEIRLVAQGREIPAKVIDVVAILSTLELLYLVLCMIPKQIEEIYIFLFCHIIFCFFEDKVNQFSSNNQLHLDFSTDSLIDNGFFQTL